MRVLLAEHGPGSPDRDWSSVKHIIHEVIAQLPTLLPLEQLPSIVVVADIVIGKLPLDSQRRSFAEAHIVVGAMGSQLANCLCMQPGSHIGAIQLLGHSDPFLWNLAAAFGVQYWALISSNPGAIFSRYSPFGFTAKDERSLKVFMEVALVQAATMLVH